MYLKSGKYSEYILLIYSDYKIKVFFTQQLLSYYNAIIIFNKI